MILEPCTLCLSNQTYEFAGIGSRRFFVCESCDLRFASRDSWPTPEAEQSRYRLHQNHSDQTGYQKFLEPLMDAVVELNVKKTPMLDFGSGPHPALAELLSKRGFEVSIYDPVFASDVKSLSQRYEFILCSEVAEHFHETLMEFKKLRDLLLPGGVLILSTLLWANQTDFKLWSYARDITHLSFYSKKSFEYICSKLGFKKIEFRSGRLIILYASD